MVRLSCSGTGGSIYAKLANGMARHNCACRRFQISPRPDTISPATSFRPMPSEVPRMPDAVAGGAFIPTLDHQGAIWLYTDEVTQSYLDFVKQNKGTTLEIAAGYGHVVI